MDATSPIARCEIGKFRNPTEYLQWFDHVLEHIINEADEENVLLHHDIYKEIHEEIFPLATLLKAKTSDWITSKFRNVLGSQSYDVEIQATDCPFAYFEIACTTFDDGEMYRMKEFLEKRIVSLTAALIRNGKEENTGNPQVTGK